MEEDTKEVEIGVLRQPHRDLSDCPSPDLGPEFKPGDVVLVQRRVSWSIPQPDKPDYKKDLNVGQEGVIVGWHDPEHRQVELKVVMDLPSGPGQEITKATYPRNLKLKYEATPDEEEQPDEGQDTAKGSSSSGKTPAVLSWALGDSKPAQVKLEPKWMGLLADRDLAMKHYLIKSRIGTCMQSLLDSLPVYTEADFCVIQRQNDQGSWKAELWTKRDFGPLEIMLAPVSSQVKQTHFTAGFHVLLTLPKCGRGVQPEKL